MDNNSGMGNGIYNISLRGDGLVNAGLPASAISRR